MEEFFAVIWFECARCCSRNEERKKKEKEKRLMRGYTERNKELFSPESVRHYNHRAKGKENYRMREKGKERRKR